MVRTRIADVAFGVAGSAPRSAASPSSSTSSSITATSSAAATRPSFRGASCAEGPSTIWLGKSVRSIEAHTMFGFACTPLPLRTRVGDAVLGLLRRCVRGASMEKGTAVYECPCAAVLPVRFGVFLIPPRFHIMPAMSPLAQRPWARSRSAPLRAQERHGAACPVCEAACERNRYRRSAFGLLFCSFRLPASRMRVMVAA